MSSNNTIWNKKFNSNHNNIKEGLDIKNEDDRSKKDEEQHKVLDDIKRKLETMANKRKGFTKLPHLEGLDETIEEPDNNDEEPITEGNEEPAENIEKQENSNDKNWWSENSSAVGLGISYVLFLFTYLQFYHLNFKNEFEDIEENPGANKPDANKSETNEEIVENILDSFAKTLGKNPSDKEYRNIINNAFLKTLNWMASFDGGIFLRYILIPAQVIVILLKNFIPNAKLFIDNTKFTALFFGLFGLIFTSITITKYTDINKKRKFTTSDNWFYYIIKGYYSIIPTSYFIVIGLIIIAAFGLDILQQMGTPYFWGAGPFGILLLLLFKIFALSLSVVLSGFSFIPIAIYLLWWIFDPDPDYRNIFDKFPKALKHSYLIPENDVCESNILWWTWKFFSRKLWNNKILLLTILVIDAILVMSHTNGREDMNPHLYWLHGIIGALFIVQLPVQSGDYGLLESIPKGMSGWRNFFNKYFATSDANDFDKPGSNAQPVN